MPQTSRNALGLNVGDTITTAVGAGKVLSVIGVDQIVYKDDGSGAQLRCKNAQVLNIGAPKKKAAPEKKEGS